MATPSADHGYTVHRREHPGGDGQIHALRCQFCAFSVNPKLLHKAGDRSGQGRYNRARGKMVAHLYAEHRDKLQSAPREPLKRS